jgi:hypothetical protein
MKNSNNSSTVNIDNPITDENDKPKDLDSEIRNTQQKILESLKKEKDDKAKKKSNNYIVGFQTFWLLSLLLAISGASGHNIIALSIGFVCIVGCLLMKPFRGLFKSFACAVGWHSYDYDVTHFDGALVHAKCQWCGYEGKIDSQGNIF